MELLIYYSILLFAFIVPISRAGISFFVIFLPLLWLIDGKYQEKFQKIKSNKFLLFLAFFIVYSLLSSLWSENLEMAFKHIRLNLYFITLFVIATSIKKEQIAKVITFFLYGMLVSEIISYGIFFEMWKFNDATVSNPVPFMHHIHYSVFLSFTAILLLNRIFSKNYTIKEKILFSIFFMTATGNLFLAEGRTGQVIFLVGIILITVLHYKIQLKSLFFSSVLILLTLFMAYQLSDTFKNRLEVSLNDIKNISKMDLNGSLGIRIAYYMTSLDIIENNIIFGVGLGDYIDETKEVLKQEKYNFLSEETKEFMGSYSPHNQFLLILLQQGLIGFIGFIYLIYLLIKTPIENEELKKLFIIYIIIFLLSCMTTPPLKSQFPLSLFILFIGIFISQRKEN